VAVAGVPPRRYQLLGTINAVHTSARDLGVTDWSQILALYDQPARLAPLRSSNLTAPPHNQGCGTTVIMGLVNIAELLRRGRENDLGAGLCRR
jgi:hypothetical protein